MMAASQLLDEFAEPQRQLKSFIAQYEYNRQDEEFAPRPWKGRHSIAAETRFDGRRISERSRIWGQINPNVAKLKSKPYIKSSLFDGQWAYQYDQPYWRTEDIPDRRVGVGLLNLRRLAPPPKDLIESLGFIGSGFITGLGRLPHDGKRFDARLREAPSLWLREKQEVAGWIRSRCYVLEGDTPHGQYTVWLDPAHGYQMAKGILRRGPGHRRGSWTLQSNESDLSFVEKVRFAQLGGHWVPVEWSGGLDNTFVGGLRCSMRFQCRVTKFLPNPNPEALGSFVPDDIRNGSRVYVEGGTNTTGGLIRYQWQDGRVVDKAGKVILDFQPNLKPMPQPTGRLAVPGIQFDRAILQR